jgi:hypothetical protein
MESAETSNYYEVFPGTYLCRFEQTLSVSHPIHDLASSNLA